MSVCAIVAEYNPFHCGHKYQLDEVKKNHDTIVVVMSGSFTQRGEPAIINKWERAKSAVLCGASLVLELPTVYAVNTAERFAFGAVSLINSLSCVDTLSFGSECGDISALYTAANHLAYEDKKISEKLSALLKSGMSYASARAKAYESIIDKSLLSNPNNILALEYIRQLILLNSNIVPTTIKRLGSGYHSQNITSPFASASAIRSSLSDLEKIKEQLPTPAFEVLKNADKYSTAALDAIAAFHLRKVGKESMKNVLECTEGIENRIYRCAQQFSSIEEIAKNASSKRTPISKIRRIILTSLLSIDKSFSKSAPEYARILAFDSKGRELLSKIKENSPLTLVTKPSKFENEMLKKDILSTDLHALLCENPEHKNAGADYLTSPFIL